MYNKSILKSPAFDTYLLFFMPGGTKTSYALNLTCKFQLQVCLSMYAFLLTLSGWKIRVKKGQKLYISIWSLVFCGFFNGSLEWKWKLTCIKCLKSCCAPILVWIIHSFLQGWKLPLFSGNPPPFCVPPLFEANLKSYPLFLRAIQIGACKL